jgi:hypothetical protein
VARRFEDRFEGVDPWDYTRELTNCGLMGITTLMKL